MTLISQGPVLSEDAELPAHNSGWAGVPERGPDMPNMPIWNNVWNGWPWQMAFWMIGAAIVWIALIALVAWLIARWEMRALRRVNVSALRLQRAQYVQDAYDEADMERFDEHA